MTTCLGCGKRMEWVHERLCEDCQDGEFAPKRFVRYLARFHFDAIDCCYFYDQESHKAMHALVHRGQQRYWALVTSKQPEFCDCIFIPIAPKEIGEISVPDDRFRTYLLHNLVDPVRRPCLYTLDAQYQTLKAVNQQVDIGLPSFPINYVMIVDIATILFREFQQHPRVCRREMNAFWETLQFNWMQGTTCLVFTDDSRFTRVGARPVEPDYRIGSKIQLQPDPRGGTKWRAVVTQFSGSGPQEVHRGLYFDPWRQAAPDLTHFFWKLRIPVAYQIHWRRAVSSHCASEFRDYR